MHEHRHAFFYGFRKTLPFQSGVIPFGVLYATIAISAGFPWWLVILFSVIVFAGSSQLVFIDLYQYAASAAEALLGSNIVNARHLIYSAGVTEKFSEFPPLWRLILSYLLTDQLYAFAETHKDLKLPLSKDSEPWFYFGSGFCTWSFWVLSSILGIVFGHIIPSSWNLGFSIPLMFMPLVFSVSKNRFAFIACALAILFTFLFKNLPYGLGVFFAILGGGFVAYIIQKYLARPQ